MQVFTTVWEIHNSARISMQMRAYSLLAPIL